MIIRRQAGNLTWIDLESPNQDEIKQITEEFKIHSLVAHEMSIPTLRPRVDLYPNSIYLILHFPTLRRNEEGNFADQEIDFIIGKDFIITARYGDVDAMVPFSRSFEVNSILGRGFGGEHAGFVFFVMLSNIYESLLNRIESIKGEVGEIENKIFKGEEQEMVVRLSEVSRELLDFKRATSLHHEILESFEIAAVKFFGDDFKFHLHTLIGEYYKIENSLRNSLELVAELRATNNALITTKQNSVMQSLTVITFIVLPLTFIVSLFQIPSQILPIIGLKNDFWIIILAMTIILSLELIYFKWKKWL